MGAKGKKKGGKKKKKKGGIEDKYDPGELRHVMSAKLDSLQDRMARTMRNAEEAKAAENERRYKDLELAKVEKREIKTANDIMSDMTRQYKST